MKKLVSIPYLTLITLSLLTLLYFGNDSKTDDVLYNEVSEISIVTKNDGNVYSSEVLFNQIIKIFKKYNVSFYKYSYINEKKLNIYTFDYSIKNKIKTFNNKYPNNIYEYISNEDSADKNKVDNFDTYIDKIINIFNFNTLLKNDTVLGTYIINTTDKNKIKNIIEELNLHMNAKVQTIYKINYPSYLYNKLFSDNIISQNLSIPISSILIFLTLGMLNLIEQNNRNITILKLHGYRKSQIYTHVFSKNLKKLIVLSNFISSILALIIILIFRLPLWVFMSFIYLLIPISIFLIFIYSIIFFVKINLNTNFVSILNKKHNFKFYTISNLVSKSIILLLFFIYSGTILNNYKTYQSINLKSQSWEESQDVYRITETFVTDDFDYNRKLEIASKELYEDLENKLDLFIMDCSDYYSDVTFNNKKHIRVNKNYFKYNKIKTTDNIDMYKYLNKLDPTDNTMVLLLPEKFKNNNTTIKKSACENFYFNKITIPSEIYKENIKPINNINLKTIYYKNNSKFFTYNELVNIENGNILVDPIVYLDTNNIDPSCYRSLLTRCSYFKTNNSNPFLKIKPIVEKNNLSDSYKMVISVYNQKINFIQNIQLKLKINALVASIFIVALVVLLNSSALNYCIEYRKIMFIKSICGYNLVEKYLIILMINFLLDVIAIILSGQTNTFMIIIFLDMIILTLFIRFYESEVQWKRVMIWLTLKIYAKNIIPER